MSADDMSTGSLNTKNIIKYRFFKSHTPEERLEIFKRLGGVSKTLKPGDLWQSTESVLFEKLVSQGKIDRNGQPVSTHLKSEPTIFDLLDKLENKLK